ncbi:MAG: 30S ribosomal protein S1 [Elusimicrobia bacterium]|nr:30S ribosomal protein S1 [Elusimicrobiota bacterium]
MMAEEKISMEDVLRHVENTQKEQTNRVLTGVIISIDERSGKAIVDIGDKSEGELALEELEGKDVKPGDEVEVFIVKKFRDFERHHILSHTRAKLEYHWEKLFKAYEDELVIDALIEKRVKGGLIVDVDGVKGFMPASLAGYPMVKNLDSIMGKSVPCKIIEFDREKRNIVVSWRKAIEEDVRQKREDLFEQLYPGKVLKGEVTGIKSFGAFIDLGGVDGLLHISELSWGHVDKVEDVLQIGDVIEIQVKSFNPNSNRIALSLKDMQAHPWENILDKYQPGDNIEGTVTGVTNYGAFVELEPGVEGLVRTEELSWTDDIKHAGDLLKVKDQVEVKIMEVDEEDQKIALSIKLTQPNPWKKIDEQNQQGSIIDGEVTHLTEFGAFVMLPEGVEGLLHISDMSWNKDISHPSDVVSVGDKIKLKVLNIDPDRQKVSLGLKQLDDNPYNDYPVGSKVKAKAKAVHKSGAYFELPNGLEAYLHISNYSRNRIEDLREHLTEGTEEECKVTKNNADKKFIEISIKDLEIDEEKKDMKKYMGSSTSGSTLYDLIGDKLEGLTEDKDK